MKVALLMLLLLLLGCREQAVYPALASEATACSSSGTPEPTPSPGTDRLFRGVDWQQGEGEPSLFAALDLQPQEATLFLGGDGGGWLKLYAGETPLFIRWTDRIIDAQGELLPYAWENERLLLYVGDTVLAFAPPESTPRPLQDSRPSATESIEPEEEFQTEEQEPEREAAGLWQLTKAKTDTFFWPAGELLGGEMTLHLREDGSAALAGPGVSLTGLSWQQQGAMVRLLRGPEVLFTFSRWEQELLWHQGCLWVFERVD